MLVYIIATILTLVFCWWLYPANALSNQTQDVDLHPDKRVRKKRIVSCLISMLPLFLVMGFRWNVGVDVWHTYTPDYLAMKSESVPLTEEEEQILLICTRIKSRLFGDTKTGAMRGTLEDAYREHRITYHHTGPGFQLLERILIFFRADVQWLYVMTSLLIMGFTFAAIWQQTAKPLLPCLFFVITANFFLSMNIIAQYIAVAVCLFSCRFAEERKPVWFFLLVGLAATFHPSALVFLPVYFIPKLRIRPVWCIVAVGVALAVGEFGFPLIQKLVEAVAPKYAHHLSGSADFEWIFFAIGCAVLALGTYYYPKAKDLPFFRLWYYMNVIGLIALAFSGHIPLIKRINYYFAAPHFLLIPMLLSLEEKPVWRKALRTVTIGLFCAMIAVAIGKMNRHGTLPYQAFFQGDRVEMMLPYVDHLHGMWD